MKCNSACAKVASNRAAPEKARAAGRAVAVLPVAAGQEDSEAREEEEEEGCLAAAAADSTSTALTVRSITRQTTER
jgi:hypothetical protein